MKSQTKRNLVISSALGATIIGASMSTQAMSVESCTGLVGLQVQTGTVIAAERIATGEEIPGGSVYAGGSVTASADFCRVSLVLTPTSSSEIKTDVWLPDNWNQKMFSYGGGGFSGGLGYMDNEMNDGLSRGYVAATSDLGHEAGVDVEWAHNQPEKVIDFGHRANHLLAVTTKQLITAYYGTPATQAYFQGCSGGGREALMEVSRYPQDYDGVIAGAAPMSWGELMSMQIWRGQVAFWVPNLMNKLAAVNAAVMEKCDALDGVEDGVLENPQNCDFDPAEIQCGLFDTNSCLAWGEVNAIRKIYRGPQLSTGEVIIPGLEVGSEGISWLTAAFTDLVGGEQYYKWMVYNNPWWSGMTFNLDQDYANSKALAQPIVNSDNPDISAFVQNGGKLLMYHGWNDTLVPGANSVRYFDSVSNELGSSTQDSVRLFMMPGEDHCTGSFDAVQKLEDWVESGQAPDEIVVTNAAGTASHPACPWPQTAHYDGVGDTNSAESYTCAE